MQLPKLKSSKKERKQYNEEGFIESLTGIAKATGNSIKTDLVIESSHEAWDELLLADKDKKNDKDNSHGGDLSAGHELNLSEINEKAHEITEQGQEFISEVIHAGKRANTENSQEISVKIQEILIEIKQLSNSSGELQKQVEVISMEQIGENPGVYHVNFLEQMLGTIRNLRMSVEDSLAWFGALRSKKASRQYGVMAKKHGTSFTLSNERTAATQVG